MTIYETIKAAVPVRQAAEHYGLKVNRNGMACCPFHNDRHPSMKLNELSVWLYDPESRACSSSTGSPTSVSLPVDHSCHIEVMVFILCDICMPRRGIFCSRLGMCVEKQPL